MGRIFGRMKKIKLHKRNRADIFFIIFILTVLAIALVPKIFKHQDKMQQETGSMAADSQSIGPEKNALFNRSQYADLELTNEDFIDDETTLPSPAYLSDALTSRIFTPVDSQFFAAALDREIERIMIVGNIPSLAIALVSGDKIVWTRTAGLANIRVKTPAACDSVYVIGSTFKTMSTVALLQQLDKGKFKLDDPVSNYLDEFNIKQENRRYPVTFRHLLTHTSGLPTEFVRYPVWSMATPAPLAEYLRESLKLERRPGSRVVYSNIAYTLVAYLVEKFSGIPFTEYMTRNIFSPIGMSDTAFEPRADMVERLAIPYVPTKRRGVFKPVDWARANVWPAGLVYGTVIDQARWLMFVLNGCVWKGQRFLSESAFREMMKKQYEQFAGPINGGWLNSTTGYGLTWWISREGNETIIAHSGSIRGYTAFLAGSLERKIGVAILTNGNRAHRFLYDLAIKALTVIPESGK